MRLAMMIGALAMGLCLAACGQVSGPGENVSRVTTGEKSSAATSETSTAESQSSTPVQQDTSSAVADTTWAAARNRELAAFMADWQAQMGQRFEGTYDGEATVDYLGEQYPDQLMGQTQTAYVYDQQEQLTWYKGGGSGRFVVYAAAVGGPANATWPLLYLFACDTQDNTPVVLVSQTTNGDALWFYETENTDLADGFSQILQTVQTATGQSIQPFARAGERWTKAEAIAYRRQLDSRDGAIQAGIIATKEGEGMYDLNDATFTSHGRTAELSMDGFFWSLTKLAGGRTVVVQQVIATPTSSPQVVFYANDADHLVYRAYHNGAPLVSRDQ